MYNEFFVDADPTHQNLRTEAAAPAPNFKRIGALTAAFFLTLAMLLVPAQQAFAHDYLMGSNPEDGAELDSQPGQIVLSFNNEVQKMGAQIILLDEQDTVLSSGEPVVEGKNVSYDVPAELGNGAFTINWRVVSSDSHPIDGTISYTVTGEPEAEVTAPQPEETETPEPTDTPESTDQSESTEAAQPATPEDQEGQGLPWTGIIIGGAAGLAVGIILLILGMRKSKNAQENTGTEDN